MEVIDSETYDYKQSQQKAKLEYLKKEITQLNDQIKDVTDLIEVNKKALNIAKQNLSSPLSTAHNDKSSNSRDGNDVQKTVSLIMNCLYEENFKLKESINRLAEERNQGQNRATIYENIAEEAEKIEENTIKQYEEQLKEIGNRIKDKEFNIQELEKIKPVSEKDGAIIQYREILKPSEGVLNLHDEYEGLKRKVNKMNFRINELKKRKQELLKSNFALGNAINKKKVLLSGGDHKKFLDHETESDELSGLESPLPENLNSICPNQFNHIIKNNPNNGAGNNKKKNIPGLDLTKAKKIQELNIKKMQQQATGPNSIDPFLIEKIKSIETEIDKTKKALQVEACENKIVEEEIWKKKRLKSELKSNNEILMKSNARYEEKWQKMYHALEFYKEFFNKYIELEQKLSQDRNNDRRKSFSYQKSMLGPGSTTNFAKEEELIPMKLANFKTQDDHSVFSNRENGLKFREELRKYGQFHFMEKDQAKIHVLKLAKDLYFSISKTKNFPHVKKSGRNRPRKPLKRSLSSILDYINLDKETINHRGPDFKNGKAPKKDSSQLDSVKKNDKGGKSSTLKTKFINKNFGNSNMPPSSGANNPNNRNLSSQKPAPKGGPQSPTEINFILKDLEKF